MIAEDWNRIYKTIKFDFPELSFRDDAAARDFLYMAVPEDIGYGAYQKAKALIFGTEVIVVGGGLKESDIKDLKKWTKGKVVVASDGACAALNKARVRSDIVVTDLDSPLDDIQKNLAPGAVIILHGHGDNIEQLEEHVFDLLEQGDLILPTTQVDPKGHVRNFFGFTDGDRAVYAVIHFYPSSITLVGFDFENIGPYSYHRDEVTKKKKLAWAKRLLDMAEKECMRKGIHFEHII